MGPRALGVAIWVIAGSSVLLLLQLLGPKAGAREIWFYPIGLFGGFIVGTFGSTRTRRRTKQASGSEAEPASPVLFMTSKTGSWPMATASTVAPTARQERCPAIQWMAVFDLMGGLRHDPAS